MLIDHFYFLFKITLLVFSNELYNKQLKTRKRVIFQAISAKDD